MKLMSFHLMPCTEQPADFHDASPSVWIDIRSSLFDPKRAHHMCNDFINELEYAAAVRFDAVCVNEHHSNGYGTTRYNTKLFAEQVMPKLKDLHAGWEDRWWPKPIYAAERPDIAAFQPRLIPDLAAE